MTLSHLKIIAAAALALSASFVTAQQAAAPGQATAAEQPWKYKTKRLNRAEVDALLAQPGKLLVLDVRRPDELIKYGSFPVFLNVQNKELEQHLAYLPKDRAIVTVSNHAQRAGAAGDLLASKGFNVAGATGSEDYEKEGGKWVAHIQPPAPRPAAQ
jgi:rhodanese-related sulfurtransferase